MSSTANQVFFKQPKVIYVDEDHSVKPPPYGTIEKLIQSLQVNGPLIAVGKLGPQAYSEAPFKLKNPVCKENVYGWKPHTFKKYASQQEVVLRGAEKKEDKSYIYYTLAQDITKDEKSLIRGYKPIDTKVYIMSYENFLNRSLVDLHPICPHGEWLFTVDVNAILDRNETEKKCKEVGQKIFDHYKSVAHGNSEAGRAAVQRICDAAKVLTQDGQIRKSHIEHVWDGIGDDKWRWRR